MIFLNRKALRKRGNNFKLFSLYLSKIKSFIFYSPVIFTKKTRKGESIAWIKFSSLHIPVLFYFSLYLLSCSAPLSLPSPGFSPLDTSFFPKETDGKEVTEITFGLAITALNFSDTLNRELPLSDLYIAHFSGNNHHPINYLSIEKSMYSSNNRVLVALDPNTMSSSDTIDICLISGEEYSPSDTTTDLSIRIKHKWQCKIFSLSDLSHIKKDGYNFTLENKEANTPLLELLLIPDIS